MNVTFVVVMLVIRGGKTLKGRKKKKKKCVEMIADNGGGVGGVGGGVDGGGGGGRLRGDKRPHQTGLHTSILKTENDRGTEREGEGGGERYSEIDRSIDR